MTAATSRLPLPALAAWCRSLKHALGAGMSPVRVFRHQAKSGPRAVREVAADVADRMEKGDSLEDALQPHRDRLPPMFVEMAAVGEQSGRMEDVFAELARYYESSYRTRMEFRRLMIYPAVQLVAAGFVIALLIVVMGFIGDGRTADPLGVGLTGPVGAVVVLALAAGALAAGVWAYRVLSDNGGHRPRVEAFMLRVPAWGAAVREFALHRFCLALRVATEAGMPTQRAVHYGFRATANGAFLAGESDVIDAVMKGGELAPALERCGAPFPATFVAAVETAEVTGQLPEVMDRLSDRHREEGVRALTRAAKLTGYAAYAVVGLVIVFAIFRIAGMYLDAMAGA